MWEMSEKSTPRRTGLFQALQISGEAPQWRADRLLRLDLQRHLATNPRLTVHHFSPVLSNGEGRAAAVVACRDVWDCEIGDLTTDEKLTNSLQVMKLLPQPVKPDPAAYIPFETWHFEPRTVRFFGQSIRVWERVGKPLDEDGE